jgi:outer membrane biosynthesis protein TonB
MGEVPYPGMNNQQSIAEVRRGYRMPAPERCPEEVKQLMLNCWREDPQERPSFSEIYKELLSAFKTTTPNIEKRALKESRFTGAWAFSEDEAFSFSGSSPIPSNYLQRDPAASGEFPNTPSPQTPTTPRTPKERTPKTPREKTPKTPKEKTPPTPREKILKWSAQMEEEAKKESEEGKLRKMKTEKSFNWEQFA